MKALTTIETAPRTIEGLELLGMYNSKVLFEKLEQEGIECWSGPQEKVAVFSASARTRAEKLFKLLQQYDQQNGATQVALAPTEPPQQESTALAVVPSAPEPVKRQPRTRKKTETSSEATEPTESTEPSKTETAAVSLDVTKLQDEVKKLHKEILNLSGELTQLNVQYTDLLKKESRIEQLLSAVLKMQELHTGLLSMIGEESLQAPKETFLKEALKTGEEVLKSLE